MLRAVPEVWEEKKKKRNNNNLWIPVIMAGF